MLELHGWGELQTELNQLSKQGQWVAMGERIDDEVLNAFAVVAPIDELGASIARTVAGVADRTSLHLPKGVDAETAGSIIDTIRNADS